MTVKGDAGIANTSFDDVRCTGSRARLARRQQEPVILSHPEMGDRYFTFELAGHGLGQLRLRWQTHHRRQGRKLCHRRPRLEGRTAAGVQALPPSLTPSVLIFGRTLIDGPGDATTVNALQDQYTLIPLSLWGKKDAVLPASRDVWQPFEPKTDPLAEWRTMNQAMTENAPDARLARLVDLFARIGADAVFPTLRAAVTRLAAGQGNEVIDRARRRQETAMTRRILVIGEHATTSGWLRLGPVPPYQLETASGSADAVHRLRQRAFEVVVTSPETPIAEDLALLEEVSQVRPGVKAIVLAPAATPLDVIAALRARVFACYTAPFDPSAITKAVAAAMEASDWHEGIQVLTARPEWIGLRVTCSMLNADRLVQFMTELRSDIPATDRDDLLLAFREMLLNAMEHGAGFDPEKVVEVAAVRTRRAIVYYFRDPGPGFQLAHLGHAAIANPPSEPAAHLDRRASMGLRAGGFGILLVRELVDEVIYSEVGNEVLLIKHLPPPARGHPQDDRVAREDAASTRL